MIAMANPLTYSIAQAAERTSLHKRTIYRLIKSGDLRSKLVGRRRLIDARSLHEYLGLEPNREEA